MYMIAGAIFPQKQWWYSLHSPPINRTHPSTCLASNNMRNPYLKEHLLDVGDKAGAELGQAIRRRWQLDYAIETQKEKSIRLLSVQQMAVIIAYGIVVAVYVISSAVAMWSTSSGALEILFTLSFLQGPFVIYQRLQLIKSTGEHIIKVDKSCHLPTDLTTLSPQFDFYILYNSNKRGDCSIIQPFKGFEGSE